MPSAPLCPVCGEPPVRELVEQVNVLSERRSGYRTVAGWECAVHGVYPAWLKAMLDNPIEMTP